MLMGISLTPQNVLLFSMSSVASTNARVILDFDIYNAWFLYEFAFSISLYDFYLEIFSVKDTHSSIEGCTSPGYEVHRATKFCTVVPSICRSSVPNMLHIILLAHKILRWIQNIWKICSHLYIVRRYINMMLRDAFDMNTRMLTSHIRYLALQF